MYPPVKDMELCQPDDPRNAGLKPHLSEQDAAKEMEALKEAEAECFYHHRNCDDAKVAKDSTASPSPLPAPVAPEAPEAPTPVPVAEPVGTQPVAEAPTPIPMCGDVACSQVRNNPENYGSPAP